jgi:hypothetical protein
MDFQTSFGTLLPVPWSSLPEVRPVGCLPPISLSTGALRYSGIEGKVDG